MATVSRGSVKQRLSSLLDVDLDAAVPADGEEDDMVAAVEEDRPAKMSEWVQATPADDLRALLKSLLASHPEIATQISAVAVEERAHRESVVRQEQEWTKPPPQTAAVAEKVDAPAPAAAAMAGDFESRAWFVPLRLSAEERSLLNILEGALYVSEYTDQVDVYYVGNKARRMALQIQQVCAIIAGLVVANNFDVARRPLTERGFAENEIFFRSVFEIGRRRKILNPDKMRGSYGKLIHMLQDSVKDEVIHFVEFECVAPVRTVASMLKTKTQGTALLRDPLLNVATREVYQEGKTRAEVDAEVREKESALAELKRKYAERAPEGLPPQKNFGDLGELLRGRQPDAAHMSEDNVECVVKSLSDYQTFQRYNREPVERMIEYLKARFGPGAAPGVEREWSLEISRGRNGSCLSHSHRTQYAFVLQTLILWREIMGNMFVLWQQTEDDLLDPALRYRLCDTGQGLHRMQSAPRVSRMMHQILHKVQSEVEGWVGLSVVHLGDRDVPNALVFIDKYTQVPRILRPLVSTLDGLPEVYGSSAAMRNWIDADLGGLENLRMMILQDFFKHGFDGSGDDGGSCVDGRLTSCWNWCSKIEKKKYFPAFLVTGFTGFDGEGG